MEQKIGPAQKKVTFALLILINQENVYCEDVIMSIVYTDYTICLYLWCAKYHANKIKKTHF